MVLRLREEARRELKDGGENGWRAVGEVEESGRAQSAEEGLRRGEGERRGCEERGERD